MYKLNLAYGYVDEPETWLTEAIGRYKSLDEACKAADSKFAAIMDHIGDDCDACDELYIGEVERGYGDCYVTYGYYDCELGCVLSCELREYYYRVYVIETM